MAARPLVLCYSFVTPPKPAPEMVKDLFSRHYEEYFTLVEQKAVSELSEKERETMRGLLVTGGSASRKSHMDIVGKETMDLFPNLKVISSSSTGVDIIDVEAASARGIRVGHSPGHFCSDSVADFAFGLLLTCARSILRLNKKSRENLYQLIPPGQQVSGSTIGIVGLGNIGRAVAERAKGFKMNILYHNRTRKEELEKYLGLQFCSELKELLEESDFVVLCLPNNAQTQNFISTKELSYMKSSAILINVGRGTTVNHDDLTVALQNSVIKGAALDVTEPITLPRDHPLLNMPNVIITPHIASHTAFKKMYSAALDNLKVGINGEELLYPVN